MSPLEEALQEQKNLINKGYSVEEVKCAALQIISEQLRDICGYIDNAFHEYDERKVYENGDD